MTSFDNSHCARCLRTPQTDDPGDLPSDWEVLTADGEVIGVVCPDCLMPQERQAIDGDAMEAPMTGIHDQIASDTQLSHPARSLLSDLLDPASCEAEDEPMDGPACIRAHLRELEEHGHLTRERTQDEQGCWSWSTRITARETPKRSTA